MWHFYAPCLLDMFVYNLRSAVSGSESFPHLFVDRKRKNEEIDIANEAH